MPTFRQSITTTLGVIALTGAATVLVPVHREVAAASSTPAASGLRIEQAWIRWLPANLPAGGYLTIINTTGRPHALTGASSPDYAQVQLHRSVTVGGMSHMAAVARIDIAPHATLRFASQGYHLMLMHPTRAISPGAQVPIELQFDDGERLLVRFQVRAPAAGAPGATQKMPNMPDMPGMGH